MDPQYLLTGRVIVDTHPEEGDAFANFKEDNDDGILIPDGSCRMPHYDPDAKKTSFGVTSLWFDAYDLAIGTPVTCLVIRGRRHRWHAVAWAPANIFGAARFTYSVHQGSGNGFEVTVWKGDLFDLSRFYQSDMWDDGGVIWRNPHSSEYYRITEATPDARGETPREDPRLSALILPPRYTLDCLPRPTR